MPHPLGIVLLLILHAGGGTAVAGAGDATRVWEEIISAPEGLVGLWTIGDRTVIADDKTQFDLDHPPTVGCLAQVDFIERDGPDLAIRIKPHDIVVDDISDGPHVRWIDRNTAEVFALIHGTRLSSSVGAFKAPTSASMPVEHESLVRLDPVPPTPPPATVPMPERLLVVSDIEGQYKTLKVFLKNNGVIDSEGHWSFGTDHLLFNGDTVDRGDEVTATLLLIMRLEREAQEAGGRVHFVLGNHEAMVLGGDLRYVHPKYRFICGRLGLTYDELLGPDTDIGRWLRTRNSLIRVGDFLFVHAGYGPQLDALKLEPNAINQTIRQSLGPPAWPPRDTLLTSLAWHRQGPLWYRGYFDRHAEDWGGRPTDAQLQAMLTRHDVKHIVVGHTVVDDIGWLDDQHRVLAVDVHWADPEEAEGVLIEDGLLYRIDSVGQRTPLAEIRSSAESATP